MHNGEWERGRAKIKRMRDEGFTDQRIRKMALERGWTREHVEQLLTGEDPQIPPPAQSPEDTSPRISQGLLAQRSRSTAYLEVLVGSIRE